jgi:hypothetical protein
MKPVMFIYKLFLFLLIFSSGVYGFAQNERRSAFAYGIELNRYTVHEVAYGAVLSMDFNMFSRFAAGFNLTASSGGYGNSAIEPSVLIRYYFDENHTGFFAQVDTGIVLINEVTSVFTLNEDNEYFSMLFLAGIRCGYRFGFGELMYIEPYIRGGYPFLLGAGLLLGYRY